jgi:hypothetical protein
MALGPGRYDELATYVREQAQARAVVVIIIGGDKGGGFSVQAEAGLVLPLPALLRSIADRIEGGENARE